MTLTEFTEQRKVKVLDRIEHEGNGIYLVYPHDLRIEILVENAFMKPLESADSNTKGEYLLIIGNQDWRDSDLSKLESILYNQCYVESL